MSTESSFVTRYTVLVVDDTSENLYLITGLLKDDYSLKVANSGEKALKLARSSPMPDVILLDVMMPEVDGYEVCAQLKADPHTASIPIIFLTSLSSVDDESKGLALGAVDYITKPINPPVLLARLRAQLLAKQAADLMRERNASLEAEIARRAAELSSSQDVFLVLSALLAERRHRKGMQHTQRTQHTVRVLARALHRHPRFEGALSDVVIQDLFQVVPLHDIGKAVLPEAVFSSPRPGPAEPRPGEESHPVVGKQIVEEAESVLDVRLPMLALAKELIYSHHERWDGTGFPEGLSGDDIPVSARLLALCDTYDLLTHAEDAGVTVSHGEAVQFVESQAWQRFDPDVVEAFLKVADQFKAIGMQFPNH